MKRISGKCVFSEKSTKYVIDEYVNNFKSSYVLADEFGVDGSTIKKLLNENGVEVVSGSAFSKKYWVKRGMTEEEAIHKLKTLKPIYLEYWINKGYSEEEAQLKVEIQTMKTERAFVAIHGERGRNMYRERMDHRGKNNSVRRTEYWMRQGLTEEEARKEVANIQRTYSRDILHEKHGREKGEEILKKRNDRWQKSLRERDDYDEIQKRKDSSSPEYMKDKYGDTYIREMFNNRNIEIFEGGYKEDVIKSMEEGDYDRFATLIENNIHYDGGIIHRISNLVVTKSAFNMGCDEIKSIILSKYNIKKKQKFGTTYIRNGVVFRSLTELKIYDFLVKKGIEFDFDATYPNQEGLLRYDFYLKDRDIYIEYLGMLNVKEKDSNRKTLNEYRESLDRKIQLCKDNNFKYYFSKSADDIINYIKGEYDKEEN